MKIRAKLCLFAIFCSVLPLVVVFKLSLDAATESIGKTVEQNLLAHAVEDLAMLQNKLTDAKHRLFTFSTYSNLQQVEGSFSLELHKDLGRFAEKTPLYEDIIATDASGVVVAASQQQYLSTDLSGTWEYEAPRLGVHFDGRVGKSNRLDKYVTTQSVPIVANYTEDRFIGTLIGSINWEYLKQDLSSHSLFGGAQNHQRQVFLESVDKKSILYATEGVEPPIELFADVQATGIARMVSYEGNDYVMVSVDSKAIGEFRDPGWRYHLLLDADIAYASSASVKSYFYIVGGGVLFLALLASYLFARSIVRPVNSLLVGAEKLANGNYDEPLPDMGRNDEIGQLTSSFNSMSIAIQTKQEQLERKTAAAENAVRAKSEFLANMSHEVRTPINGVLGMTELLLNTPLNGKQLRYTETISKSGQSLLAVINDVLDYSKIEAGKLDLSASAFDLRELVEDVIQMLAEGAYQKGVGLYLNFPPDFHVAYSGDANRIRQVLMNLIGNAIKFTSEGEIRLIVTKQVVDGGDTIVKFAVSDTGIGIPEEQTKSIFESFVQVDGTSTRQFGGTGLGLSISAKLAQLMGGEIGVSSEQGKGSTFWFTANLEVLPASVEALWHRKDSLTNKNFLVVDDNATNREIMHTQLSYWGGKPVMAENGHDALNILESSKREKTHFDAIILDMQMPELNGLQVAEKIRAGKLAENSRIVMFSSACDQLTSKEYRQAGIHSFATKPVRQPDLYNCLTAAINSDSDTMIRSVGYQLQKNVLSGSVLLAEDNIVNQDMMTELLGQLGVDVQVADNGQMALDALANGTFDTILMDCQMPVLDGFEATRKIRQQEKTRGEKNPAVIIALTANVMDGYREKCLDAGMDEYLSKPVSSASLVKVLSRWLEPTNQSGTAEASVEEQAENESSGYIVVVDQQNVKDIEPDEVSESAVDNEVVLDESVYSELLAMCEQAPAGFYDKLVAKYRDTGREDIQNISVAISDNNGAQVGSCAHRLKSSSANWGGRRMAKACEELEFAGKDEALDCAKELLLRVEQEFDVLLEILDSNISKAA